MKRFVLGIVVICWITIVFAAGNGSKATGILSGKTNKAPVEFATIALYEATTKKLVTGAMTDSTGYLFIWKMCQRVVIIWWVVMSVMVKHNLKCSLWVMVIRWLMSVYCGLTIKVKC